MNFERTVKLITVKSAILQGRRLGYTPIHSYFNQNFTKLSSLFLKAKTTKNIFPSIV